MMSSPNQDQVKVMKNIIFLNSSVTSFCCVKYVCYIFFFCQSAVIQSVHEKGIGNIAFYESQSQVFTNKS